MNWPVGNTNTPTEPVKVPGESASELPHEPQQDAERPGEVVYTAPPTVVPGTPEQSPEPIPAPSRGAVFHVYSRGKSEIDAVKASVASTPEDGAGAPPRPSVSLSGIETEGDVLAAGRDIIHLSTRYQQGPALLRTRELGADEILPGELFVSTGEHEDIRAGVYVLAGRPNTGRRTAARRVLGALRASHTLGVFRAADWDEPDMTRIPNERGHAYLLDLTGMGEALSDDFAVDLVRYAEQAKGRGTLLVIVGDEGVGRRLALLNQHAGVVVREHRRPDALRIARSRIRASSHPERETWLDDEGSVFHGRLMADAPPGRGVALANAVLEAENQHDEDALGPFTDWQGQIQDWFAADVRGEGAKGAEKRTLRIAAAFLDGSPAPAVLNAADELLPKVVRDRFEEWGGALAAPDDRVRCREAEVSFKDGRIHVTESGEGLDLAVIRYLWDRRGSAAERLTAWLSEISAPKGPASECLDRLSEVLTEVAVARGSGTVLALLERWLKDDVGQRMNFVVKVLQRLSENPVLGARVRVVDLRNWAKGTQNPERQRAVIEVCRGRFAENYPEQALMRLRYVVQNTEGSPDLRRKAVSAIVEQLAPGRAQLPTLKILVDWVEDERTTMVGGRLFLDLFGGTTPDGEATRDDPSLGLLTLTGPDGEEAVELFTRAWGLTWNEPELRSGTSHALVAWRSAADAGHLPFDRARRVLSAAFRSTGVDEDLDRVLRAGGEMGYVLRKDFWVRAQDGQNRERPGVPE